MRTTISLDDNVAALAEKMAKLENRNFSNLCEVALAAYCSPVANAPEEHAKLLAKVDVAAKHPATRKRIERAIAQGTRQRLAGVT
jgi:hypothetical protein